MIQQSGFSPDAHRYLDGEAHGVLSDAERQAADRLTRAVAEYAEGLALPGAEVDAAVRAAIGRRRAVRRPSLWRWLVEPTTIRLRPAWVPLAAALALFVVWQAADRGAVQPGPVQASAAPVLPETVYVRFELVSPEAESVALAGSFNGWEAEGIPLVRREQGGLWTATVPLPVGEHKYLFVVDGEEWIPDPRAHAQVDDGFGGSNSVIVVGPKGVVRS